MSLSPLESLLDRISVNIHCLEFVTKSEHSDECRIACELVEYPRLGFVSQGGAVYTGILRTPDTPADRPVTIQVLAAGKENLLDNSQIVQMVATSERFWQRFNGEVSFGVIYSKGNQSTQYSLGSQTAYVRERWTALADFNSSLSSSSGTNASTRNSFNFGGRHLLRWNN